MPHRSMCKSLKFPREPCWTKMRSLGWLSIKMSLIQPWKAVMGFKHWESVKLSGHPVGKREEAEKNIGMFNYFCWDFLMQELRGFLFQMFLLLLLCNLLCYKSSNYGKKNKKRNQPLYQSMRFSHVLSKIKMWFFFIFFKLNSWEQLNHVKKVVQNVKSLWVKFCCGSNVQMKSCGQQESHLYLSFPSI